MNQSKLKVLSLGAGVQSTTILLMACRGEIEKPHVAIFADTGWEKEVTYKHLEWLRGVASLAGIPVEIVQERNIRDDSLNAAEMNRGYYFMPVFMLKNGKVLIGKRQCTDNYKLRPIFHKIRELLGVSKKARLPADAVEMWVGFSLDAARISVSHAQWLNKRFPLVERMMTRNDCIKWLWDNYQLDVPKSSCIGCPYHDNDEWQSIRAAPAEWEDAILVDETIRHGGAIVADYDQFLHKHCIPLRDIDLRTPEEKGQLLFPFYKEEKLNLFAKTDPLWLPSEYEAEDDR